MTLALTIFGAVALVAILAYSAHMDSKETHWWT